MKKVSEGKFEFEGTIDLKGGRGGLGHGIKGREVADHEDAPGEPQPAHHDEASAERPMDSEAL